MSNSLQPHGLYNPWNSPGQNTEVGSLSLLQGIFPTQESNQGLLHYRQILYQLSSRDITIGTLNSVDQYQELVLPLSLLCHAQHVGSCPQAYLLMVIKWLQQLSAYALT